MHSPHLIFANRSAINHKCSIWLGAVASVRLVLQMANSGELFAGRVVPPLRQLNLNFRSRALALTKMNLPEELPTDGASHGDESNGDGSHCNSPIRKNNDKMRRRIIFEAARLMYSRRESEYYRAKLKAARKICGGWVKPKDLPSNAEIREEIQRFAFIYEGDNRLKNLREMRLTALSVMRMLKKFRPRLIGSTLTGHVRSGSDIDIHVFASTVEAVAGCLDEAGMVYEVEHKRVRKHGEERLFTHIHVQGPFEIELTLYPVEKARLVFKSSITGKAIERATIPQLEQLLTAEYPDEALDQLPRTGDEVDRFTVFRSLLVPLAAVEQGRKHHPEGDVLYHSLQVFELARDELPYDEEFLLAALLHDVGKGIDPMEHVAAGLEALKGFITERTHWLIENHMEAHKIWNGSIGARSERRLREHPDFEELELLSRCDKAGRQRGAQVPEVEEALDYIRDLTRMYG